MVEDCNAITGASFYRQNGVPSQATAALIQHEVYQVFSRQILAFQYFDSLSWHLLTKEQVKIFCFENKQTGKRKFLVSSWNRFLKKYFEDDDPYSKSKCHHGHYYEIIREHFPCRAYFDLEYSKRDNPETDGNYLTSKWIQLVLFKIYELFGLSFDEKCIVVLDSSTSEKFSKHVMLNTFISPHKDIFIPVYFKNNSNIGLLVEHILHDITYPFNHSASNESNNNMSSSINNNAFNSKMRIPKPEYEDLWVNASGTSGTAVVRKSCFVDLGVYSRNRAFRIFGCSKYGKHVTLKLNLHDKKLYRGLDISSFKSITENEKVSTSKSVSATQQQERLNMFDTYLTRSFVVPLEVSEYMNEARFAQLRQRSRGDDGDTIELVDYGGMTTSHGAADANSNTKQGVFIHDHNKMIALQVESFMPSALRRWSDSFPTSAVLNDMLSQLAPSIHSCLPTLLFEANNSDYYDATDAGGSQVSGSYGGYLSDGDQSQQSQTTTSTRCSQSSVSVGTSSTHYSFSQSLLQSQSQSQSQGLHTHMHSTQSSGGTHSMALMQRKREPTPVSVNVIGVHGSSLWQSYNRPLSQVRLAGEASNELVNASRTDVIVVASKNAWEDRVIAKSSYANQSRSWFPLIDAFVEKFIVCPALGGAQGRVGGWTLYRCSLDPTHHRNTLNTINTLNTCNSTDNSGSSSNNSNSSSVGNISNTSNSSSSNSSNSSSGCGADVTPNQVFESITQLPQQHQSIPVSFAPPLTQIASNRDESTHISSGHYYKLRYQIANNKYCFNVGRSHKSNGIMIEVDFRRGCAFQLCWDPECRHFRSSPFVLPRHILPHDNQAIEDNIFEKDLIQCLETNPCMIP